MYDLDKIIVIGDYYLSDKEGILTLVMHTDGMKILDLLYVNSGGIIGVEKGGKKAIKAELKSELYDDMYDDDLNIKVKEAFNGADALDIVAKFINKIWSEDSLVYYYDSSTENLDYLKKELEKRNGRIYIGNYHDELFTDGKDIEKDIKVIMKEQGLNTANMLADSTVSFMYFLHGLVEKLISK